MNYFEKFQKKTPTKTFVIYVKQSKASDKLKQRPSILTITEETTIGAIKEYYCNEQLQGKKDPTKVTFRAAVKSTGTATVELKNSQTLAYYSLHLKKIIVFTMSTKLVGGALSVNTFFSNITAKQKKISKDRKLDLSDKQIKKMITNKKDCVYFDSHKPRVEMGCGHALTSKTMFGWIDSLLTKNDYSYDIYCPICKIEWDYDLCARIADMSEEEYMFYYDIILERSSPEMKECPNKDCGVECERPENLSMFRVHCTVCTGSDWCWLCGKLWIGGGFQLCGNIGCPSADINYTLKYCGTKKANGVEIPELRACTKCYEYIEHDDACKHMKCISCGHEFCFSCLKSPVDGKWPCGSSGYNCTTADRQQLK